MKSGILTLIFSFGLSSSLAAASDGNIKLGADPLFAAATEIKIDGTAAYVIAVSMYRAKHMGSQNIQVTDGLVSGENFSCREYQDEGNTKTYLCAAKYNHEYKGELRPLDPEKVSQ